MSEPCLRENIVSLGEYLCWCMQQYGSSTQLEGETAFVGFNTVLEPKVNYFLCDGTADDVQIQAAIDYVEALGGGKVFIEVGDYAISATVTAEPGIYIIGSGMVGPESGATTGCTTLVGANATNMFEFNVGGAKTWGGGIRDLTITLDAATMGMIVDNICEFQIDGLHIRQGANTYSNAIELRNDSYYASIRNTFIHDFTVYGVRVLSNMVLLDSLWIEQSENGSALILIQGCSETRVVNCKLELHAPGVINHIEIEDGYRIIIANNKISGGEDPGIYGIYVSETGPGLSYEIIIDGNVFDREEGRHITFWEAGDYSVISNNTFIGGGGEDGDTVPILHFRTVTGLLFSNNILDSDNNFATNGLMCENPARMIIEGNYLRHDGTQSTILFSGTSQHNSILGNTIDCTVYEYAIIITANVDYVIVEDNNIITGGFSLTSVNSTATHNRIAGTIAISDGVHVPTKSFDFTNHGGGSAGWTDPVINTTPGGIDIDANDEFAYAYITLPEGLQKVLRIKIWGYSNVIEGTNNMLLRLVAHGATSNEAWSGNAIDVVNKESEEEGGIAIGDVVHWIFDSGDDAQIATLAARDYMEILAVGEAASAPDAATDVLLGGVEIEYV